MCLAIPAKDIDRFIAKMASLKAENFDFLPVENSHFRNWGPSRNLVYQISLSPSSIKFFEERAALQVGNYVNLSEVFSAASYKVKAGAIPIVIRHLEQLSQ